MENSLPKYITLTEDNIDKEHICCAFSDKKCLEGYESKKEWLKKEFANGYVFRRLDARAKVFIEYVPAEYAWLPVTAPNYLMINCFWVSGQYKGQGHGYNLLQFVIEDAKKQPFRITHKMVLFCTYNSNQSIFLLLFCFFNHKLELIISMPLTFILH